MEFLTYFIDLFLHLDKHLVEVVTTYGTLTYAILFLIVFCETGLVVTPILPGDSLLFAAGAIAAAGSLNVLELMLVLFIAAVLGDTVNYHVGKYIGPKVFTAENPRVFKKKYLDQTQAFFAKHGGKAIIYARFVPIVRTFAPFLAGVGRMNYFYFISYNIVGAFAWVFLIVGAGYLFGEIPVVKNNFSLIVIGIVIVSLMPVAFEFWKARSARAEQKPQVA